jgi:hypothetical protein
VVIKEGREEVEWPCRLTVLMMMVWCRRVRGET